MSQVAWGSLGADNMVDLKGTIGGHTGSALVRWSGDPDFSGDEYGLSIFKRISRGLKKVAKTARPFVNVTAAGAAMVFPPAAPLAAGVAAATNVMAKLDKGTRRQRRKAKAIIMGTVKAAKRAASGRRVKRRTANVRFPKTARITGTLTFSGRESKSQRAYKVLRAVYKARKRAKAKRRRTAYVVHRTGFVQRVM